VDFIDQDLKISLISQEWYGQTLRTLVFSSVQIDTFLKDRLNQKRQQKEVYDTALKAYMAWDFKTALEGFKKVISMNPDIAAAYVKQALIALRNDDFGSASALALKALDKTAEHGVKAEAKSVLAIIALRNDSKAAALKLLNEAAGLAPEIASFKTSINQLKNAEYDERHISKTAARLACIAKGSSSASQVGVLARGWFPDMGVYKKALKKVSRSRSFKSSKKSYMQWECR
jgi:tetratricopeptide (TPR) repeat protein